MPRPPRARWALPTAIALLSTGCGGTKTVRVPGSEVTLRLDEYRILPRSVSIRPGRIKVVATDTGILTHNLRIQSPGSSRNPVVYGTTEIAHPGQTVSVKVTLPPGHYKLICTLSNHGDLGQIGTLIVR